MPAAADVVAVGCPMPAADPGSVMLSAGRQTTRQCAVPNRPAAAAQQLQNPLPAVLQGACFPARFCCCLCCAAAAAAGCHDCHAASSATCGSLSAIWRPPGKRQTVKQAGTGGQQGASQHTRLGMRLAQQSWPGSQQCWYLAELRAVDKGCWQIILQA